jgi:hypothetical protein
VLRILRPSLLEGSQILFSTTSQENGIGQQVCVELFHTLIEHCHLTSLKIFLEGLPARVLASYALVILSLMFNPARLLVSYACTIRLLMSNLLLIQIQAVQMMSSRHNCNPPSIETFPSHSCTCALEILKSSSIEGQGC